MLRPLPPFARIAKLLPYAGNHVWVICGPKAWHHARIKRGPNASAPVLVLPPGEDPYQLHWPVITSDITVIDTGAAKEVLEALGHALLRDGAALVVLLKALGDRVIVFRREATSA